MTSDLPCCRQTAPLATSRCRQHNQGKWQQAGVRFCGHWWRMLAFRQVSPDKSNYLAEFAVHCCDGWHCWPSPLTGLRLLSELQCCNQLLKLCCHHLRQAANCDGDSLWSTLLCCLEAVWTISFDECC